MSGDDLLSRTLATEFMNCLEQEKKLGAPAATGCYARDEFQGRFGDGANSVQYSLMFLAAWELAQGAAITWSTNKLTGSQLIRTTQVGGVTVELKSGHGYNRVHNSGDVSQIGSMDEVEGAIVQDVVQAAGNGTNFVPVQGSPYYERSVMVNGHSVTYRVVQTPNGVIRVSTYFPK